MRKTIYIFTFLFVISLLQSCKLTVSPIQKVGESNQDKLSYENQQLEYVATRSASQQNAPILLSDILFEMKKQYGDITISNIRKQSITELGRTTYYVVFDVVKVSKTNNKK